MSRATTPSEISSGASLAQPRPRYGRALLCLFLLGATLGAALDGIHTHFGATAYPDPICWRMAWWTPLLFGGAFAIGVLRPLLDRWAGSQEAERAHPPGLSRALLALGLFVAAYFLSVLPLRWPLVTAILIAVFVTSYWLCDRSRVGLVIALGAALGGPLVEMTLVHYGRFVHLQPLLFGVPGWLPALYLCAAVAMTTLARFLVRA